MLELLEETSNDIVPVREVNAQAFGRPDEGRLVDQLRTSGLIALSFVAHVNGEVVGSVVFSNITIQTNVGRLAAVALAPLAVRPAHQRRGIGAALVREGLRICTQRGKAAALVLGDPSYYNRFGFSSSLAEHVKSPWSGPAWMALELVDGALRDVNGRAIYPDAFQNV